MVATAREWLITVLHVARFECGRPAELAHGRFFGLDGLSKALEIVLKDYVRIIAPAGCIDPVAQFEREAGPGWSMRLARAIAAKGYEGKAFKLSEAAVGQFAEAITGKGEFA